VAGPLLVGVTGAAAGIPWAWWATRWQLSRAGAVAVRLTARTEKPDERFSGFVIGGGNDIDPAIYGGDVSLSPNVDSVRDEYELAVLQFADQCAAPVLGICRGAQLMNVHAGGNLIGDVSSLRKHTSNRATLLPRKRVQIEDGSELAAWVGSSAMRVNSLHHQAIDKTGRLLRVVATDRDGIVQAIEGSASGLDQPLRMGVQWHPEYLPQRTDQRHLFAGFVAACRRFADERN